jgi:hypothetical protein
MVARSHTIKSAPDHNGAFIAESPAISAVPTGKSASFNRKACQALQLKIFFFRFTEIYDCIRPSRLHQEGRIAIVTDVGSGERWTRRCFSARERADEGICSDERNRVVLISRR